MADRQLDPILDHALEEAGAIGEAVAVLDDLRERCGGHSQRAAGAGERRLYLVDLLERDRPHFVLGQRREDDDLVDAVAQLWREPAFELACDFSMDLIDANLLRAKAERTRQLAEVLRA